MPHHRCSFCPQSFKTRQQLGGHQTSHRGEIDMLRKEHGRFMMKRCHCRKKMIGEFKMVSLHPNPGFWWAYRTYGRKPKVIDFFQGAYKVGDLVGQKAKVYCKVTSQEVDLTLKL